MTSLSFMNIRTRAVIKIIFCNKFITQAFKKHDKMCVLTIHLSRLYCAFFSCSKVSFHIVFLFFFHIIFLLIAVAVAAASTSLLTSLPRSLTSLLTEVLTSLPIALLTRTRRGVEMTAETTGALRRSTSKHWKANQWSKFIFLFYFSSYERVEAIVLW